MKVSIIIPVYNEEENLGKLVSYLYSCSIEDIVKEVIVVDGGSTDNSIKEAEIAGAVVVQSSYRGRSVQMNSGAKRATGNILYFLHADSYPPEDFCSDISAAIKEGLHCGCYRLQFDYDHWFLRFNCWFTRFNSDLIRFGDQSLFVSKEVFDLAGGYNEKLLLMEDLEIISRLRKFSRFKVLNKSIVTSARKYLENGIFRLQGIFILIYFQYRLGYPQEILVKTYRRLIKQSKL